MRGSEGPHRANRDESESDNVDLFDPDSGQWIPAEEYYQKHNIPTYNDDDCRMSKTSIAIIAAVSTLTILFMIFMTNEIGKADQEKINNYKQTVNQCDDKLPVIYDVNTGDLYGDQNHDHILSGAECDWK